MGANDAKVWTELGAGQTAQQRHHQRVYPAFLEADAVAKWLPPYGFTCKVHHMDAQVGGTFRMSFTNFGTGNGHSLGGDAQDCPTQLATGV